MDNNNMNKNQNQNQFGGERREAGQDNQQYKGGVSSNQNSSRNQDIDTDEQETGSQGVQPRSDKAGQPSTSTNANRGSQR